MINNLIDLVHNIVYNKGMKGTEISKQKTEVMKMTKIFDDRHEFEIVENVPKGYEIWNIGKNMIDGYLPLCQVIEGTYSINPDTLKAIKVEDAQVILSVGFCSLTIKGMERYVKRYSNSKTPIVQRRVERAKKSVRSNVYIKIWLKVKAQPQMSLS